MDEIIKVLIKERERLISNLQTNSTFNKTTEPTIEALKINSELIKQITTKYCIRSE